MDDAVRQLILELLKSGTAPRKKTVVKKYEAKVNVRISLRDYEFLKANKISISMLIRSLIAEARANAESEVNADTPLAETINRLKR